MNIYTAILCKYILSLRLGPYRTSCPFSPDFSTSFKVKKCVGFGSGYLLMRITLLMIGLLKTSHGSSCYRSLFISFRDIVIGKDHSNEI